MRTLTGRAFCATRDHVLVETCWRKVDRQQVCSPIRRPGRCSSELLGPLEAQDGERRVQLGRPKQRVLLALLLVHANQVVSLDRLVEEMWGEEPPPQAAASLQTYVSNLRRALEPDRPARAPSRMLVSQPPGYRLVVGTGDLDAAQFAALAEEGHQLQKRAGQRPPPRCYARGWRCGGAGAGRGRR